MEENSVSAFLFGRLKYARIKEEQMVEVLAPAGSYEAMTAAVAAGADAVYIGGSRFGARAYADNLDEQRMLEAIDYMHLHGKRLYLTVNTLLKERELKKDLYSYLLPYYREGLDAVIVQDFGVLSCIREWFPDLAVHASTQMTVTGAEGAALLEELGVVRVVPARELSLQEIASIREHTNLEIETFVHGALCYCYSGQCLFSSILGGRSGNRGRCAQPCRLPYEVYESGRRLNGRDSQYVLSPKDMCTVELLPQIVQAGVTSLKIEGRMKKPEYTAGVVRIYRKYLDLYENNPEKFHVEPADMKELYALYNRDGFNKSYYQVHNGRDMMAMRNEKKAADGTDKKNVRDEQLFERLKREYSDKKIKLPVSGLLQMCADHPMELTLTCNDVTVHCMGECPQPAQNRPLTAERVQEQMEKTGSTPFAFADLDIRMAENLFLPMQQLNTLRRDGLEQLEQAILNRYRRRVNPPVSENTWTGYESNGSKDPVLYALTQTQEQAKTLLKHPDIRGIYICLEMFPRREKKRKEQLVSLLSEIRAAGKDAMVALAYMIRDGELKEEEELLLAARDAGSSAFLVRNLESFAVLKRLGFAHLAVLDSSVYTWNNRSVHFWQSQGVLRTTVPAELNSREITERENSSSELVIYGYLPLMISAQCVKKNTDRCTKENARVFLKDRYGKKFAVQCCCDLCYNVIYNSLPYGLYREAEQAKSLGCAAYRLNFTVEDSQTAAMTADAFAARYLRGSDREFPIELTKGHYKRGVE